MFASHNFSNCFQLYVWVPLLTCLHAFSLHVTKQNCYVKEAFLFIYLQIWMKNTWLTGITGMSILFLQDRAIFSHIHTYIFIYYIYIDIDIYDFFPTVFLRNKIKVFRNDGTDRNKNSKPSNILLALNHQ